MSKDETKMNNLLEKIMKNFEMTVNENPASFLGLEIRQNKEGIFVT